MEQNLLASGWGKWLQPDWKGNDSPQGGHRRRKIRKTLPGPHPSPRPIYPEALTDDELRADATDEDEETALEVSVDAKPVEPRAWSVYGQGVGELGTSHEEPHIYTWLRQCGAWMVWANSRGDICAGKREFAVGGRTNPMYCWSPPQLPEEEGDACGVPLVHCGFTHPKRRADGYLLLLGYVEYRPFEWVAEEAPTVPLGGFYILQLQDRGWTSIWHAKGALRPLALGYPWALYLREDRGKPPAAFALNYELGYTVQLDGAWPGDGKYIGFIQGNIIYVGHTATKRFQVYDMTRASSPPLASHASLPAARAWDALAPPISLQTMQLRDDCTVLAIRTAAGFHVYRSGGPGPLTLEANWSLCQAAELGGASYVSQWQLATTMHGLIWAEHDFSLEVGSRVRYLPLAEEPSRASAITAPPLQPQDLVTCDERDALRHIDVISVSSDAKAIVLGNCASMQYRVLRLGRRAEGTSGTPYSLCWRCDMRVVSAHIGEREMSSLAMGRSLTTGLARPRVTESVWPSSAGTLPEDVTTENPLHILGPTWSDPAEGCLTVLSAGYGIRDDLAILAAGKDCDGVQLYAQAVTPEGRVLRAYHLIVSDEPGPTREGRYALVTEREPERVLQVHADDQVRHDVDWDALGRIAAAEEDRVSLASDCEVKEMRVEAAMRLGVATRSLSTAADAFSHGRLA